MRSIITNLTPASRRQDHTTSPSAPALFVYSAAHVHRIPPLVRDDRDTPLLRDGTAADVEVIWVKREQKYFCDRIWTSKSQTACRANQESKLRNYERWATPRQAITITGFLKYAGRWKQENPDVASLIRTMLADARLCRRLFICRSYKRTIGVMHLQGFENER
jgi:hypothetical protein